MLDENPYSSLVVFNGLLVSCWLRAVSLNHSDSDKHKTNDNKVFKKGDEKQTKEQKAYGGILLNITKKNVFKKLKNKILIILWWKMFWLYNVNAIIDCSKLGLPWHSNFQCVKKLFKTITELVNYQTQS